MSKSPDRPVHIRDPDRARPPGKAGEAIITKFEDMLDELSRVITDGSSGSERPRVSVIEVEQDFRVEISLGFKGASTKVNDGLIVVDGLPGADGETSRSFTAPDDLESDLVDVRVDDDVLTIKLPRTAETTRVVRQLDTRNPDGT